MINRLNAVSWKSAPLLLLLGACGGQSAQKSGVTVVSAAPALSPSPTPAPTPAPSPTPPPDATAVSVATPTLAPGVTGAALVPYGLYVGNPQGNDSAAMARFQADWDASVKQLRRTPQFFGTFTDFSQDWSQWKSNASWFAWSFNQSKRVAGMKPVIGIKLSTNAYWNKQGNAFREIIAGQRDQVYRDVVTAWRDAGYTELRFRISYEFNGNFMPDNFGNDAATLDLWKKAFARVADVMHAVPGVKVLVVWNPASINWSAQSVAAAYPGDQYVDVIASDIYSRVYPPTLYDWTTRKDAASKTEWAKSAANRIKFWDYPGATQWSATGSGWGLAQALDFALQRRKPFGLGETGVGGNDGDTGPADDPEFPAYLRTRLADHVAKGGTIDHVVIWDYNASDGAWRFTGVPTRTATAAAWTAFINAQ
ncbi:glycosyl hydrolase [Sphingomonas sp. BK069]|uniref:glycosyl hydrolase n=1 Tax=Sphingomonas sp. BK069 TaxID=2586979 RepID=UPI00160A937F|nr:glycosyl hydrolase [Sphingomonas sp. BK069]MBB3348834.1 hypothetical protein [Sphingomonas sp. BK069]